MRWSRLILLMTFVAFTQLLNALLAYMEGDSNHGGLWVAVFCLWMMETVRTHEEEQNAPISL